MTPLFPCLPASLSPTLIFLFCATYTLTSSFTPGWSSAPCSPSRTNLSTAITVPVSPCGTTNDVFLTSFAFSPKIALRSRSSGVNSVSPLGVTFPTNTSPGPTSAPILMMPSSFKSASISSEILGISLVISSDPSFVSLASISC